MVNTLFQKMLLSGLIVLWMSAQVSAADFHLITAKWENGRSAKVMIDPAAIQMAYLEPTINNGTYVRIFIGAPVPRHNMNSYSNISFFCDKSGEGEAMAERLFRQFHQSKPQSSDVQAHCSVSM